MRFATLLVLLFVTCLVLASNDCEKCFRKSLAAPEAPERKCACPRKCKQPEYDEEEELAEKIVDFFGKIANAFKKLGSRKRRSQAREVPESTGPGCDNCKRACNSISDETKRQTCIDNCNISC